MKFWAPLQCLQQSATSFLNQPNPFHNLTPCPSYHRLFFHLHLDFPRDLHTLDFPTKLLYAFLIAPMVATAPAQLILDLKTPYLQSTKVGTQVMLPFLTVLNVATDRASCLNRRIVTLYSTTRITGAPVSHLRSTQCSAKRRKLCTYVLVREWWLKFLLRKTPVR